MYFHWIFFERGERLHARSTRDRCRRIGKNGNSKKTREQCTFPCANGFIKLAEDGPNRPTTNPSRSYSNLVADFSGCLLAQEDGGTSLAKTQKGAMETKHDFCSISGSFIYRHHVLKPGTFCASRRNIAYSMGIH